MDIWLVEDMYSSRRLEQEGKKCVALLGTHISAELVQDILDYEPHAHIFLALDEDATAKAIAYRREYSALFGNFTVVPLSKDIKDMSEEELSDLLSAYGEKK